MVKFTGVVSTSSYEAQSNIEYVHPLFKRRPIKYDLQTDGVSSCILIEENVDFLEIEDYIIIGTKKVNRYIDSGESDKSSVFSSKILESNPDGLLLISKKSEFQMIRGPYSMVPCYYSLYKGSLLFAGEKKLLWNLGVFSIERLEPGEKIVFKDGKLSHEVVISREKPPIRIENTYDQTLDILQKLLYDSFQSTKADGEVGVLLSGGVDSSLACLLAKNTFGDITAISTSSRRARDFKASKQAAELLKVKHEVVLLDIETIWHKLPEVIYAIETSNQLDVEIALPFYLAAERAADLGISLLISGQGPDELFAGYAKHERLVQRLGFEKLPEQLWSEVSITHKANIERDKKAIENHGLKSFFPFLYPSFIIESLTIRPEWKINPSLEPPRKIIFRDLARRIGLPDILAAGPKKATQFSSGTSKLLIKALKSRLADEEVTRREIEHALQTFLHLIAEKIGVPTSVKKLKMIEEDWLASLIDQVKVPAS
ncbi:MAG: putative Asparagine synthase (glutamine-hydrolyzing) [Candidatus Thorarchaeota archaeon]|nr:MAG: putative Asparagine synthase (glutamine-hydrolyzing) [Candidatus Thorarchaeota archaeon]